MILLKKIFQSFTKSERVVFLSAVAAAVLSAITLAGIGFAGSTHAVPASGGEFIGGAIGQPIYVNPVTASTEIDKILVRLVFSNINDVADKIEASSDGRTWRVRLKENLRWQSGEKLTSDDIIFTVQKIQDRESSSPLLQSWQGVATERLSELELRFSLANPYAFFGDTLNNLYILPKHLLADVPPSNWRLSDYNLKPIGSGPYKFASYEKRPDGFIYLYKLELWDRYPGRKSLIQNFSFQFFSQTADLIKGFNLGQIDGLGGLSLQNISQIKRPHNSFSFQLPGYYAVFLNQSKSIPLKDLDVRRALYLATDREALIKEALGGYGRLNKGPIPTRTTYSNPETAAADATPGTASEILEKAGWKKNETGFREKTIKNTKIPLELALITPKVDFLSKTAELLQASWQKIGFKINLIILSPEEIAANAIKNRDYEMLLFGNVLGRNSDLFSFWHSSQRFYPGLNLALYNNKKADSLIESTRQNLDQEKRMAQFNDLQNLIVSDYPAIFLYSTDYLYVANKNLHGLDAGFIAEPADIFAGASSWYLKTARVLK